MWDCWFDFPTLFWDAPGRFDDPYLVRDDQIGLGPEEARIDAPSTAHAYYVGAHWYEVKNASSAVTATARVICNDVEVGSASGLLTSRWDAAFLGTVRWNGGDPACTFTPGSGVVRAIPRR